MVNFQRLLDGLGLRHLAAPFCRIDCGFDKGGDPRKTQPPADEFPHRDPNAVRSTISDHFGGVHAGRAHARDSREADEQ